MKVSNVWERPFNGQINHKMFTVMANSIESAAEEIARMYAETMPGGIVGEIVEVSVGPLEGFSDDKWRIVRVECKRVPVYCSLDVREKPQIKNEEVVA